MAVQTLPPFDVGAAYRHGDPYPMYAEYRTREPVHVVRDNDPHAPQGTWNAYIFGHADCMKWLRDQRLGREWRTLHPDAPPDHAPGGFAAVANLFMLFRDPPTHTRLRGVANLAFTPRQVEKLRSRIESVALDLANGLGNSGDGSAELIGQFAFPLPMLVIAEVLGLPREDFRTFRSVAGDIAAAIDVPVEGLEEFAARVDQRTLELSEYLRRLIGLRRSDPRDDLLSQMIHAESDEGRLNEEELVATCILLIVAGHETTVNLIGNGDARPAASPGPVARPGGRSRTREERRRRAPAIRCAGANDAETGIRGR